MPLTFAHPAAILPFSRKSKYISFSALVLGSMAPDFEYFLRGQPIGEIGHTFSGFFYYNLPLVILVFLIYHFFIHQPVYNHLPVFLQDSTKKRIHTSFTLNALVFLYCAFMGMLTHVLWDSFTHKNGYMVQKFPTILANTFTIKQFEIPLYKFLQHGSTLCGLLLIVAYLFFRALSSKKVTTIQTKQKILFWSSIILLTFGIVFFWYVVNYISILSYGIAVVRIIDSFFISVLIVSVVYKMRTKEHR